MLYLILIIVASYGGNILNVIYLRKYVRIHLTLSRSLLVHLSPIFVLFFNKIASIVYQNSDITMLGFMSGDEAAGIYDISSKIYSAVKVVLNAGLAVFLPRLSLLVESQETSNFNKIVNDIVKHIITLAIPLSCGILFLAKELILLISNNNYLSGTKPLQILGIALVFAVLACLYLNNILLPYGQEKKMMFVTILSASINALLNLILIPRYSYSAAAFST